MLFDCSWNRTWGIWVRTLTKKRKFERKLFERKLFNQFYEFKYSLKKWK